jgi:Serine/Threonine/Tyrosine Kinase found in polyvalent proteins
MGCNDVIYNGGKYTKEEFLDMANTGKLLELHDPLPAKELTDDMEKEHVYLADKSLGFNEMRAAYKAEKEKVLAQGARIQIDNGSKLSYVLPAEGLKTIYEDQKDPEIGNIINYKGNEYVVHSSYTSGSELAGRRYAAKTGSREDRYLVYDEDGQAGQEAAHSLDQQLHVYNLDPVNHSGDPDEDGGPIMDISNIDLAKDGFTVVKEGNNISKDRENAFGGHISEDDLLFQSGSDKLQSSKASDATVDQWRTWFKNTGTDLKILTEGLTDEQGNKLDANESVDITNRIVQVVEGHENTAIPEAGMHIVARLIKQHYPEIFREMMKRVDKYAIYPEVVQEYKKFKNYQLPDGKPDIAKIKEEVIGKLLAECHILDAEGSTEKPELIKQVQTWWGRIKEWLSDFFKGNPSGTAKQQREQETSQSYKDVIEKFKEGKFDDETKTIEYGLQNFIPGIGQEAGNSLIQTTAHYIRAGKGEGQKYRPSSEEKTQAERDVEIERLKAFADKHNLWYQGTVDDSNYLDKGQENKVYYDSNNQTVTKVNNLNFYKSYSDYLDSLILHNEFFPETAYTLKGFIEKDGTLHPVVEQPYIDGTENVNRNQVRDIMIANNFIPTDIEGYNYYNSENGIEIKDLHDKNVLEMGGLPYFIDGIIHTTKRSYEGMKETGDTFYQSATPDKGKELFDKIKEFAGKMRRSTDEKTGDSINLVKDPATGEEKSPEKRPSDYAKTIYEKKLGKREPTEKDKVDRETGTRLHGYLEDIGNRLIDPATGIRRSTILPEKGTILPGEEHIYDALEKYLTHTLDNYPADTRFMNEQMVYKPGKRIGKGDIGGTIDLLVIKPNGRWSNLDWKFMNNKDREDITATTQAAHRAQMGWYGTILKDGYGAGEADESHTVPFKLLYGKEKDGEQFKLKNIIIADPNYQAINDKTMLPVTSAQVTIEGDPKMTAFIQNYNKLLERTYNEDVPAGEKLNQEKKLQDMSYAIRSLILKKDFTGLTNVALTMIKGYHAELQEVQNFIDNQVPGDKLASEDAGRLMESLVETMRGLEVFRDLPIVTKEFTKDMPEADKQRLDTVLTKIDKNIEAASRTLYDPTTKKGIMESGMEKIANTVGIYNILSMDKEMSLDQKFFNTISAATTKVAQVFYKWRSRSRHIAEMKSADMAHEISDIGDRLKTWMGGTWDNKKLLDAISKKTEDGKWKPFLANKISTKFYDGLSSAIENKDHKWILDHIDTAEYKKDYDRDLKKTEHRAEQTVFDAHSYQDDKDKRAGTLDQELREKYVQWFIDTFDIERSSAFTYKNNRLRQYAKEDMWSDEYKNLNKPENKPALDFYNYVVDLNKRAHKSGMLGDYYIHFLPQIRKRSVENLIDGELKKAGRSFISKFISEEGDRRYRDELTGEIVNGIRGKYTYDLGVDGDYSNVSDDIMKSVTLYAGEVAAVEELNRIEGIAKTLLAIEKNKQVLVYEHGKLQTDITGKPIGKENKRNLEYFEEELTQSLYHEKGGESTLTEKTFTINGKEYHLDKAKTIDTLVNAFTLKAIGMNPMTALANLFGGSANAYITSGRHFSKGELSEAYYNVLESKFYSAEGKKFISLLNHFVPITEEVSRHLGKKASKKQVLEYLSGEGLMVMMRKSENIVQMANAAVFFKNTMVENGKLVNIRDYVRNKYDYANIYKKSDAERKTINELINKEVKEFQDTRNLFNDKSIKFNDNNFDINWPVERYSDSEIELRERIQQLTRDCLGNRTPEEMAHINMFLFGGALMNFRNWIPRLVQKRYGSFKYNGGLGTYEIGRMRMLGDVIADHAHNKISNILSALSYGNLGKGETSLIDIAKRQYQRRIAEARTVEQTTDTMFEKTVSEGEFVDSYLRGVKAQVKELELTAAMMIAFFAAMQWAQSLPKDDDNYPERGVAKWSMRMLDKFSDELGFFYSYGSFKGIVGSGNIIPIVSTITDLAKFTTHLTKEGYYLATGDETAEQQNKVLKYPVNYIPVVNQFSTYFGIFNEEWAKTMGYNSSYRYGGAFTR